MAGSWRLGVPEISYSVNMALFTCSIQSGGYFACAMPRENVYFLVFESTPSNHFSPSFLDSFRRCLQTIQEQYPPGVLVTASRIPHSYCETCHLILMSKKSAKPGTSYDR
ncbi:hypothetical protein ASPBRDRAFT_430780 [Aspergillus brasiliensis CBS 101740]|uniref:Longin domain-containing protein n=1 Tax=Aspergillus brasiliensis (strain CBS 101740 / IMI 381727 / IBT 21946) TaxID=767769 RepID=A0A1L9U2V4_ASPBC|nr:hypothetical protein ASPBRDRAFT_430780 [Aspergillus brasiliensis CBS 101740]